MIAPKSSHFVSHLLQILRNKLGSESERGQGPVAMSVTLLQSHTLNVNVLQSLPPKCSSSS